MNDLLRFGLGRTARTAPHPGPIGGAHPPQRARARIFLELRDWAIGFCFVQVRGSPQPAAELASGHGTLFPGKKGAPLCFVVIRVMA